MRYMCVECGWISPAFDTTITPAGRVALKEVRKHRGGRHREFVVMFAQESRTSTLEKE
jgi:hypothetical protein